MKKKNDIELEKGSEIEAREIEIFMYLYEGVSKNKINETKCTRKKATRTHFFSVVHRKCRL